MGKKLLMISQNTIPHKSDNENKWSEIVKLFWSELGNISLSWCNSIYRDLGRFVQWLLPLWFAFCLEIYGIRNSNNFNKNVGMPYTILECIISSFNIVIYKKCLLMYTTWYLLQTCLLLLMEMFYSTCDAHS